MRDTESIQTALTMAETGHLVFSTLHTNDAAQAVDRMIDVFPDWRQDQIRVQLAASLAAIVAQRLLPKIGGRRAPPSRSSWQTIPCEPGERGEVKSALEHHGDERRGGDADPGSRNLAGLIAEGIITYEDALEVSVHPKELDRALNRSRQLAGQVTTEQLAAGRVIKSAGPGSIYGTTEQPVVAGRSN